MFNIDLMKKEMGNAVKENLRELKEITEKSLSIPLYKNILDSFTVTINEEELVLSLRVNSDIRAENQDAFRVIVYGGIFEKKNGEYITVPPNSTLIKHFS